MPSLPASRITSTGTCSSSSERIACGAIFSAANSRAISRTAIWSSLRAKCISCPLLFAHDLIGKPVPTFPDHALVARLVHRRNRELRALLDAGRPARGDGFGLGVEAD